MVGAIDFSNIEYYFVYQCESEKLFCFYVIILNIVLCLPMLRINFGGKPW